MSNTELKRRSPKMIVGDRMIKIALKEYLEEKGLSLYWLHKQTGIRYHTLHSYASNKVESINLNYLYAIMSALNINDINLLLRFNEEWL